MIIYQMLQLYIHEQVTSTNHTYITCKVAVKWRWRSIRERRSIFQPFSQGGVQIEADPSAVSVFMMSSSSFTTTAFTQFWQSQVASNASGFCLFYDS